MSQDTAELRAWMGMLLTEGKLTPFPMGDEAAFFAVARDEGVIALVDAALATTDAAISPRLKSIFRHAMHGVVAHELVRQTEAQSVVSTLSPNVRVLILKGTALAYWLYESPAYRPRSDFDILVEHKSAAEHVVTALEKMGYARRGSLVEQAAGFEIALQREMAGGFIHRIDLHWRLMNNAALARGFEFEDMWDSSIAIPQLHPQARGLGRVHALAHALLHRITNMPSGKQDRLIWLFDIHLLAGGCTGEEWQGFEQMCLEKAIATPCLDGMRASRIVLGTVIPSELEARLTGMIQTESWRLDSMSDLGGMDRSHLSALPWREKIGWLRRKLIPSRQFMRHRYGVDGYPGLAKAYLGRWWVGVRRAFGRAN